MTSNGSLSTGVLCLMVHILMPNSLTMVYIYIYISFLCTDKY